MHKHQVVVGSAGGAMFAVFLATAQMHFFSSPSHPELVFWIMVGSGVAWMLCLVLWFILHTQTGSSVPTAPQITVSPNISPTFNNAPTFTNIVHAGPSQEELERRFKEIEGKIGRAGGVLVNGMGAGDEPLIYLDIQPSSNGFRDCFVCRNKGKNVAHNVQIQPIKLAGTTIEFPSIGAIAVDDEKVILPVAVSQGMTLRNNIFYWLLKDWGEGNQVVGEWVVPMSVTYEDAFSRRQYTVTMNLIFYPIKYQMIVKQNQTDRRKETWEFKNINFSAVHT